MTLTGEGLPYVVGHCGYCKEGVLGREFWIERCYEGADPVVPAAVYICDKCFRPSVVLFGKRTTSDDDERPQEIRISPPDRPKMLDQDVLSVLRGTTVQKYRDEAWECFAAGHYRAAIVVARSALQALARRYIPIAEFKKGGFGGEIAALSAVAGTGWEGIGGDVTRFGNQWAHPDPSSPATPTQKDAYDALDRLDSVIHALGNQERFGKLAPENAD